MSPSRKRIAAALGLGVAATGLAVSPASANPAGTGLVISEVYGGGGATTGSPSYAADYVELYNPTGSAISLGGLSLQYRSATYTTTSSVSVAALSGSVPANSHFLVQVSTGSVGPALSNPDLVTSSTLNMAGTNGQVLLADGTTAITTTGDLAGRSGLLDMVGYGSTPTSYEKARTGTALTTTTSVQRNATGTDTDDNSADFVAATPDPQNAGSGGGGTDPAPVDKTIAEIQGTGATSPLVDQTVHTTGVVTAKYPAGGLNGIYIQTEGTGGASDATPGASDAIFVFGAGSGASTVALGDKVDVTGKVSEFSGTTEITPAAGGVTVSSAAATPVTPLAAAYPTTEADREAHEGELLAPTDHFTVTNTYSTNQYAEIGLATGDKPLIVPTEVADAQDAPAIQAVKADNAARAVILDDGASINFLSNANKGIPLPWLSPSNPVRVGARATLNAPVILEYRNSVWKFQPTTQVTGEGASVATFQNTRTAAPEAVGGNLHLATFNVLNYFNTVGVDYAAAGHTCSYYDDRAGNHVTVNDCGPTGPRGAAEADDLARQQAKIVAAINKLGADIVSLEEIENSVALGETNRDDALSTLVDALNQAAGSTRWAYAPSPDAADLPALAEQDVIRTAFIYNPATVSLVGASKVLVGSPAFSNAREPLAQAFKPKGTSNSRAFAVVVNHFKSKGSGTDDGTGQGNANPDRVAQANALVPFAADFAASRGTDKVILTGDFNSYSMEDPIQVLEDAGYKTVNSDDPNEWTYSFGGESGSLDHVLANPAAQAMITGADVWGINSGESVAYEYSRDNYNATDFYAPDQFRASDHDPEIVGLDVDTTPGVHLNLLAVNDFHGRINNTTVKWAGTVEQLTKQAADAGADKTLLVGAGDLIGASEFASAVAKDQPTIDMFNALGLDASAVGNHEFDQGWADLRDRVIGAAGDRNAQWDYLGANVYAKGTHDPVLPEYATYDVDGITVGVIGAVTEETKSLVSPGGISDLDFGDPVAAVNRVAGELNDGDSANGEADVIMASFHAGATQGAGSNYATEVAKGGEFAEMADLDPAVDVIFNGHTHQAYAWDAPVPGHAGETRPIIQTGQYGDNVGQVQLTIDPDTKDVTAYTVRNVARTTTSDTDLVATYPRVAEVKQIVDAALAHAAEVGNQPVGQISGDVSRALNNGSYVNGKWVVAGTPAENRGAESTIGDLVGNALRDGIPADMGSPDLGIVNPGGLRADLTYAGDTTNNPANTDGVVTYAEANGVLPFVNNIWLVDLTGAQLEQVLEQQWQPAGSSRPYLQLGLSDNVRVTADAGKPAGDRITSVTIDGQPLDPAKHYTVSTFSFLGTGGDNFTAFKQGTSKDTGLVDRDLWISYLQHAGTINPDFGRQQVFESGMPASVEPGQHVQLTLGTDLASPAVPSTGETLDLLSSGSPQNTSVDITWVRPGGSTTSLGSVPVNGGSAAVAFDVPAGTGGGQVRMVAQPSGTVVTIPVVTQEPKQSTVTASASPSTVKVRKGTSSIAVTVTADGVTPTGTVEAFVDGSSVDSAALTGGAATLEVGPFDSVGTKTVEIRYSGDESVAASQGSTTVQVIKAKPKLTVAHSAGTVKAGTTRATLLMAVTADGSPAAGWVRVDLPGAHDDRAVKLQDGVAKLKLPVFNRAGAKSVTVHYNGNALVEAADATEVIEVVKK